MKTKCKVCTVMCDISRGNELRACAFEHNGDENICPFDARYLDLSEHDKQIRADAIDSFVERLKNPITLDALTSSRDRIKTFAIIKYQAGILKGDFKEGE